MRQRPPSKVAKGSNGIANGITNGNNRNANDSFPRRAGTKPINSVSRKQLFLMLFLLVTMMQLVLNSFMHGDPDQHLDSNLDLNSNSNSNHLRGDNPTRDNRNRNLNQNHEAVSNSNQMNSYDVLLKNTIHYSDSSGTDSSLEKLQEQIHNLRSQITTLESKSQKYTDDPLFFPFVIRDSRHLTPVQIDPDFHVFDYVDLTQARQPKSRHSQLLHNARLVVDEALEAKRANETNNNAKKKKKYGFPAEKYEAPCQKYSIECYAQKILQVFSYVLREFPSVQYYFYVEADNDLCVPMTMVKDLALQEKRYFINTGIGFSGWIMSRDFLRDFIELYGNATLQVAQRAAASNSKLDAASDGSNSTKAAAAAAAATTTTTTTTTAREIRPDVLASYYLTDKSAWTVTRQYWVSHTTLESLGIASLTVKDRRKDGERMRLDKHLPRCLEPRRGKWKVSRRKPYLDPRDRFGWDYFDYEVCPDQLLFPCEGQEQLKKLVEEDWRVANSTGALAHEKKVEEKRRKKREQEEAAKNKKAAAPVLKKNAEVQKQQQQELEVAKREEEKREKVEEAMKHPLEKLKDAKREEEKREKVEQVLKHPLKREWMEKMVENEVWEM